MSIISGSVDVLKLFDCRGEVDYIEYTLKNCRNNAVDVLEHLFASYQWKHSDEYFITGCHCSFEVIEFFATRSRLTPELKSKGLYCALNRSFGCSNKIAEYLLSLGADPNYHHGNYSYLHHLPSINFFNSLIRVGLDIRLPVHKGAIFNYLYNPDDVDNTKIIDRFLHLDTGVVNDRNHSYDTPLIRCAYWIRDYGSHKYFTLMQKFIKHRANIDLYNEWGESPVNICAGRGHLDQLKIIIEEWGASLTLPPNPGDEGVNYRNKWKDPLAEAKRWDKLETVAYLEKIYSERGIPIL